MKNYIYIVSTAIAIFVMAGICPAQNSTKEISCMVAVVDDEGLPVPGAAAQIKGTGKGEVAGPDGVCRFSSLPSDAVLVISCLGYEEHEVKVNGRSRLTASLVPSRLMMDEIVVVGYGTQRKKDLSGAIAKVEADQLTEYSSISVATALQGRVSGVQVNLNNGEPGANVQVRIRGTNSIKGSNEPLWIINGFPGDINMINNSDIESVEVLKDASATAIYGSRGANGVIIVTTKQARTGRPKVDYSGSAGVQVITKKIPMCNAWEYMDYLNEKASINGRPAVFSPELIDNTVFSTNWQDEIFQPAFMTDHSVGISGGGSKIRGSMGLSYFDQQGIIKNSGYQRISVRSSVKSDITDWLSVDANIIFSRSLKDNSVTQGGSRGSSIISGALLASPRKKPRNDSGKWDATQDEGASSSNPKASLYEVSDRNTADRMVGTVGLTFRPVEGLAIQLSNNIRNARARSDYYRTAAIPGLSSLAKISNSEVLDYTSNNIITYDKFFAKKHHVNIMGGMTYEAYRTQSTGSGSAYGFESDEEAWNLANAVQVGQPTSSFSDWRLLSFLGRLNYNYDDRYLLTVNFRADGSSRYNRGNKWGYFPSGAFAWRISEENFMKNVWWVSDLKLRLSYGITGSTAISAYSTLNTLSTGNVVFGDEITVAYIPSANYQGDLRWEQTAQYNAGIDASFFRNRLSFTADVYYKLTTDLLNNVEMPRSSGYITALRNIGSVSNRGVELKVDARLIDRAFKWDFGFNFSINKSRVEALAGGDDIYGTTVNNTLIKDEINLLREGEEMFLFYGYAEDGYDENGYIVYKDFDGIEGISPADKTIIGNPNPDFVVNFNTEFKYRGWSLSAFFQGSYGNDVYCLTMSALAYDYSYNINALNDVRANHWTPEKPDAKYPNLLEDINLKMSDRFVYDGSFLRMKNLELAYTFPCRKVKWLTKARVYVSGQNLFTLTSYPLWDPDVNSRGGSNSIDQGIDNACYPSARTFTIGCKLTF